MVNTGQIRVPVWTSSVNKNIPGPGSLVSDNTTMLKSVGTSIELAAALMASSLNWDFTESRFSTAWRATRNTSWKVSSAKLLANFFLVWRLDL